MSLINCPYCRNGGTVSRRLQCSGCRKRTNRGGVPGWTQCMETFVFYCYGCSLRLKIRSLETTGQYAALGDITTPKRKQRGPACLGCGGTGKVEDSEAAVLRE